ncbi:MAG: AarF/ABC1/UbiB kinase family protein [Methanobacterium sp.]|nr:AarF/ABC1/UbiB kinase family protein [Methanobacterium sp.]
MKRLREIVSVLVKYQFGNVLERTGFKRNIMGFFSSDNLQEAFDKTAPKRLRLALEELGTTFIKLGQVLSTRPDLVGKDFADELAKLQDEVPPFPFEDVKKLIEKELETPLQDLFSDFQQDPIASASIAQVHSAVLKNGKKVAVKVQRLNLEEHVRKDIIIMRYLARQADKRIRDLKYYNLPGIVDEFERAIEKEMDFAQEARNIDRFRLHFKDDPNVCAPKVYWKYSTPRILTMEFIRGTKISDALESNKNINGKAIAKIGTDCYFKQIFQHGFFHADPHPGNLFILPNDVLCFIDFGMIGHLDREFMENLTELFVFTVNYDLKGMINQMRYMRLIDDDTDIEELKRDLIDLLDKYMGAEISDIGGIINEFSKPNILVKHKIKLPKDFILLGRVLSMAEDIGRKLDPHFNGIEVAKPLIKETIRKRFNPLRILDYQATYLFELEHIFKDLPETINRFFLRIEDGKIRMQLDHQNLDEFASHLERIINRVSVALIVSSLIIGSSLIMISNEGMPMPGIGFSTIGTIIFLIASALAIILIISIINCARKNI